MRPLRLWALGSFTLILAACTSTSPIEAPNAAQTPGELSAEDLNEAEAPTAARTEEPPLAGLLSAIQAVEQIELSSVPDINTGQHSVPLDEIIFDTFRPVNRAVPLTKAKPAQIRSLRDAIPPLYEPRFTTAAETDAWLSESDIVLGYADGDEAFAYPVKILNFHEMVSQRVNGRHILVSYCPLCRSGIVYNRVLPGAAAPLLLGNTSALYESDMVMFDHQTGSYWNQVSGEAIVGPLTGQSLSIFPSQMTSWGMWKTLYPHTRALSENTGYERNYRRDPFTGYGEGLNEGGQFFFPVSEAGGDPRLGPGEIVLSVEIGDLRRVYPLTQLGNAVIQDRIGQTEVVIFSQAEGPGGAAYKPQIDGRKLTFILEDGRIQDRETGSVWNLAGRAVDGELAGAQLEPLPSRSTFWFSQVANYPEIEIYAPE